MCQKDVTEVQDGGEVFEGCVDEHAMQDILETHRAAVNITELQEIYTSLNVHQKHVVERVVEKVRNDDVIHLIVSGQGCTGNR